MPDPQYKRNIAYKIRIGDLLAGKPVIDPSTQRFTFLELGNKKLIRVNIIGNIVDKYESTGDSKYMSLTLDDGSGQIRLKTFGDDTAKFKDLNQGATVVIIGTLRSYNDETYIQPEVIREQDPKYLLIRKLELEKERTESSPKIESKQEIVELKDQILQKIKNAEAGGGAEVDKIILELREVSPEAISQEIKKLLEEGVIFEPRPGKVRWLG